MKTILCEHCGASDFTEKDGYRICNYCGSKFEITMSDLGIKESGICITDDVQRLLYKCRTDKKNAKKYANLILDIDPTNEEALKYL
jgi:hypothetical protein